MRRWGSYCSTIVLRLSRPNKLPPSRIPIACQNPRLLSTAPNPLSPNDMNRNHVLNGDGTSPSSKSHTEVKELVYNTLWDMENWSIQSTPPVQPLIVPSTSQIQSVPRAQYPPTQPTSLVQADLTILPPPTKSVPFVEPVMLAQPSLIEPAPLPVQPILSIIKPALPSQTVGPSLPALPLVEPIPCALAAFQSILPSFESVPPATIEPDAPTLSIVQEASDMQILTEQNIEENKAVYNQECFRFIAGIITTNEARSRPELARAQ